MTIAELFSEVLSIPPEEITDDTSPANAGSWTSMAHMQLVVTIEGVYGVCLSAAEIKSMTSVAAARRLLSVRGVSTS